MVKKSNVVKLTKEEKRRMFKKNLKRDKYLLIMFLPVALYYLIFCYLPMTGLVMAFQNFKPGNGLIGIYTGEWVGLKWFQQFFTSAFAWKLIRNTFLLSFYSLIFGFPIPIIFAICITQLKNKHIQRGAQVITYLPYFISTVVIVGMMTNFLSPSNGIINQFITKLGGNPINFMNTPSWFRPLYVISGSWQTFGFNSIIFVAAIMGISPELYEAMRVDGANKREQIRYLVLPMIKSTIILLLIMSLGSLLSVGFEKVYLMYNPAVYDTADVISTYVYRQGIENKNFSYATAVGLFNSLIGFTIVSVSNWFSRKFNETSIW
ncbi:sugar ABC transporter permease [Anaerocolumna cellulosilytica]|uniref:Sugar ABC transporter permease n=1 Tax=Anaerocolumna cellulosilytica TaxID=433286 RepID=A0A6S6R2D9_9FIRM|nr:ABC transporter permease subunit [Anaerocolumna cellulosilytica]MBB5196045.1 putative aldouronate transport system permease protein [Anaerocolumna cellulosilytica]BCJ93652.1 sugar ABC transporter permease [Anaerocolumna cellulosilytica]